MPKLGKFIRNTNFNLPLGNIEEYQDPNLDMKTFKQQQSIINSVLSQVSCTVGYWWEFVVNGKTRTKEL